MTVSAGSGLVALSESWANPTTQTLPLVPDTFNPLTDADKLEIPVELVFRDVAQEAAELSASGFAHKSKGDDNALGSLRSHGGKCIGFPPDFPCVLLTDVVEGAVLVEVVV